MDIQDLGSIGELVAALATVATLVYLATQVGHAKRQLHESSEQARAEFTLEVGNRSADVQLRWFSPEGPNRTMMKALLTTEKLTPEEAYEFSVQMAIFFGSLVQSESLQRRGLVDPEFLELRRSIYKPYLKMPRVRSWWKREGNRFYAYDEAAKIVNQMISEIEDA